ncbi:hypothetical protein BT96DRAFT_937867 [Gymnopus androsaceus JB14]|uniref:F-box domain-containing protein n=1 Tax=Gymnopus androsaceus JB14 TaxID=1447944 RepID=A0A6A4HX19_9AGAR|nr:hypothetical protein BT96DRAFT_937867 [Gymnopus androsaceus JB14]
MLQYVGANLRELHLQSPCSDLELGAVPYLRYTPNLHTLRLYEVIKKDRVTSIPWVKYLLEPSDRSRCIPKQLVIELYLHSSLEHLQWAHWVELDTLLEKPQFSSLETVDIRLCCGKIEWEALVFEAVEKAEHHLQARVVFLPLSAKGVFLQLG